MPQSYYYESMFKEVSEYVEKYHMLSPGDTVAAGISGGADSVCLLLMLHRLREKIPFHLLVIHVNHLIRENAEKDAAFVKELCARFAIPFFLVERDVHGLAKERGISLEEAGRMARYEAFHQVLKEEAGDAISRGTAKIAVAHNLNDRAETMLFRLFRGSGLTGLCSIRPMRKDARGTYIIHPLLFASRDRIEEYLEKNNMSFCMDDTNDGDAYTRNRIRHHILPFAEKEIAAGAVANMGRAADILGETEDFLELETRRAYEDCSVESTAGEICFLTERFLGYHPLLQKRMLLKALEELTPARRDITGSHIEDLMTLFTNPANRMFDLPHNVRAFREYAKVRLRLQDHSSDAQEIFVPIKISLPGPGETPLQVKLSPDQTVEFKVFSYEKSINIPQNQYTKWLDYDKIKKPLEIRIRQEGDYLTFNAAFSKKTIQNYMVEEKIPKRERDRLLLLGEEHHILWVFGYRISSYYKLSDTTRHVLEVRIGGGEQDV